MKKLTLKDIIYLVVIVLLVVALTTVSVLYGIARAKEKEEPSYYDQKCAAFALENRNYAKGQIVFIGDSITDGYPLAFHPVFGLKFSTSFGGISIR